MIETGNDGMNHIKYISQNKGRVLSKIVRYSDDKIQVQHYNTPLLNQNNINLINLIQNTIKVTIINLKHKSYLSAICCGHNSQPNS